MESRPTCTFASTVLSSALTCAFLNLATSAFDHPRALAGFGALGLPLAAGFVVLVVACAAVLGLARASGRLTGLADAPLAAALHVALGLGAALAPLVEVGLRGASRERALVVLSCAAGFVVCAALATHALVARRPASAEHGRTALLLVPLASLCVLGAVWAFEYRAASGGARAGVFAAGAAAGAASFVLARRLRSPAAALGALAVLVLGHGAVGVLGGALGGEPDARPPRSAATERPPVVLVTVDTLRADRVLGDSRARVDTPAIDALAADSVVFTQARSAAPWTKPSLATLLTGLSPLVHGMTNRRARLAGEIETLAERLRAAGYRTGGLGLNVHLERAFGLDQGFDDYAFPARLDQGIALGARVLEALSPTRFPELFPSTTAIAEAADEWIRAHADEPFFLWLHVLDPHWPYAPPGEWLARPEAHPRSWGEPDMVTDVQAGNTKPGAAERERVAELYAGEIRYVDAELARVLGTLRELGLYERALIVLASDHGEEFWEHGRYEHGHTLYDEVLRVPLFFKLPGAAAGASVDAAVSTEALTPTVLDVLGVPFEPERMSTRSLAPWWRAPESAMAEPVFASGTYYFGEKRGVVFDGKKLVLELDTERSELYHLPTDPRELFSLASARPDEHDEGLRLLRDREARCAELRNELGLDGEASVEAGDELLRAMQGIGYGGRD